MFGRYVGLERDGADFCIMSAFNLLQCIITSVIKITSRGTDNQLESIHRYIYISK